MGNVRRRVGEGPAVNSHGLEKTEPVHGSPAQPVELPGHPVFTLLAKSICLWSYSEQTFIQ